MDQIELMPAMRLSASGLHAERTRLEVAANNLANAQSTSGDAAGVYRRRQPIFAAVLEGALGRKGLGGVEVADIVTDNRPPARIYAPYHPQADADGMVHKPNISPMEEMLDMITATRAYEANLSALRQSRKIAEETIRLGKA